MRRRGSVNNLPEHTTHYTALHLCASIFTHSNQHHSFSFLSSSFVLKKNRLLPFSIERRSWKCIVFFLLHVRHLLVMIWLSSLSTLMKDKPWRVDTTTSNETDMWRIRKENYHVDECQFVFVFRYLLIVFFSICILFTWICSDEMSKLSTTFSRWERKRRRHPSIYIHRYCIEG